MVSPYMMWAIVGAGFAVVLSFVEHVTFFGRSALTLAVGVLALANWLYFFVSGVIANRTPGRSAAGIERLATTGVYAKVRHPIYSADIILAWGVFVNVPTLRALLCVVWMTMVLLAWMRLEEAALVERFGEEYEAYRRRTPMVIPRLFR